MHTITIVGGPMFSGKTTWLLKYARSLESGSFILFKPTLDTRYATHAVVSHNGESLEATNIDGHNPVLPALDTRIKAILFDELNFFSLEPLLRIIKEQQLLHARDVVGVGLLFDTKRREFGATLALSKMADKFVQLYARCDVCGKKAANTYSKVPMPGQVRLGTGDTYGACCDSCYNPLTA